MNGAFLISSWLLLLCLTFIGFAEPVSADLDPHTELKGRAHPTHVEGKKAKPTKKKKRPTTIVQWLVDNIDFTGTYKCKTGKCTITSDRSKITDPKTRGVIWYSSNAGFIAGEDDRVSPEAVKYPHHHWILYNDESPCTYDWMTKQECLGMFHIYAGILHNSTWPQNAMHFDSQKMTRKPVSMKRKRQFRKKHAPLLYIQSNCHSPTMRDEYVKELMEYIPIDCYGKCLHNRDLPENIRPWEKLSSDEFLDFVGQYKFTLSFENCEAVDYVTEKYFRPLEVGSVPVYNGAPNIADWFPGNNTVIHAKDFASPKELAEHILALDADDAAYEAMLAWKKRPIKKNPMIRYNNLHYKDTFRGSNKNGLCRVCDAVSDPDVEPVPLQVPDMGCVTDMHGKGCRNGCPETKRRFQLYHEHCTLLQKTRANAVPA